jgi:hypothetical protein
VKTQTKTSADAVSFLHYTVYLDDPTLEVPVLFLSDSDPRFSSGFEWINKLNADSEIEYRMQNLPLK